MSSSIKYFLFLFVFLCSSCSRPQHIVVRNDYLTVDRYASFHVGTPDPRLLCPEIGQMLTIYWNISDLFNPDSRFSLLITVRFGNLEQIQLTTPIEKIHGSYEYRLTDSDYRCKKGILAYKIELIADGRVIDTWRHQLWVELIEFNGGSTNS